MLTVKEVSARLGVTEPHVRKLCELGRLRAVDVGLGQLYHSWRIPEAALVELEKHGETVTTARLQTR